MNGSSISPSRLRHGFTLLELLVVLGIIGVLLALLLPAIQNARSAARSIECKNNMKQLGIAASGFYEMTGRYPDVFADTPWTVEFLPTLEEPVLQEQVVDALGSNDLVALAELGQTFLREYSCPQSSGGRHALSGLAFSSYALNFELCVSEEAAACLDGRSNTMLATEMEQHREAWLEGPVRVATPIDSAHKDTLHLLLCDGSVHTIGHNIDESVLSALETPNGGDVVGKF